MTATFAFTAVEGTAEASAGGDSGAVCVAMTFRWNVAAATNYAAETVASPAAVVVVVERDEGEEASASPRWLLLGLALGLISAKAVVDDFVVFVDTALHLGLAATHRHGKGG